MVELDKKNGEQKGLRTQVASLNHWTASGHVVVSDIFIILYYIIVLFFSKIRAPGRVEPQTSRWEGQGLPLHTGVAWSSHQGPCFTRLGAITPAPGSATSPGAREPHQHPPRQT